MSMFHYRLCACSPYNVTLLAMNKTFCLWLGLTPALTNSPLNMWASWGQGLACKLRFEVICSQLHLKCQYFFFFCHLSHLQCYRRLSHVPQFNHSLLCLVANVLALHSSLLSYEVVDKAPRAVPANSHVATVTSPMSWERDQSADPRLAEGITLV